MFKNYFLVTVRNLKKNSTYSLLNILGLAVGMTAFILIALYVQYELSFDKYHENADRIHIGIVSFLISDGTALLIAYLTVSYQSIKSARANPVDSLRYE